MSAFVRVLRTVMQLAVGAGGTAIISLVVGNMPATVTAAVLSGLTLAAAVLHNVADKFGWIEAVSPRKFRPAEQVAATVVSDLAKVDDAFVADVKPGVSGAARPDMFRAPERLLNQGVGKGYASPVPDVAGEDLKTP